MEELIEIGRNAASLRRRQRLTQEDVAFQSNLCVNCLQAIEHGHNNATVDTLIHVSNTLGIDPRVIGFYSRTDDAILSEVRQAPRLPEESGDAFQFCKSIWLMRKKRGLTQKQLALIAGVSDSRLRDIEHRCANVTMKNLRCIARALGLSLTQLACLAMAEDELMELVRVARNKAGYPSID